MTHCLHDLVRHNLWATQQILDACQHLDEATLNSTAPGTYGTILATLRHMIDSEMSYLYRLIGAGSDRPWQAGEVVALPVLMERVASLTPIWEQFLASDVDTERLVEGRGSDHRVFEIRAGIVMTQAFHHANEHRAQICSILGAQGIEPPDVSAWGYGLATGRYTQVGNAAPAQ